MSKTLLVPIHIDALCLAELKPVVKAMSDYKQLPYTYKGETFNSGLKNLSETAINALFTQGFSLEAGIHLHWSLPDALTTGEHQQSGTTFPSVPNRWLILRTGGGKEDKTWILESDYLYPEIEDTNAPPPDAINILIEPPDLNSVDPDDVNTYQYQRYRYMGRNWLLTEWQSDNSTKEYAESLTAIGTKATIPIFDEIKATFAAFYPNCYSVFGFNDPDFATNTPPSGLQYDVIGWYSDEQEDCLRQFFAANTGEPQTLLEALQEKFSWTIEGESPTIPNRSLYHARISFGAASRSARTLSEPTIAVANSAPEALAAYLAYDYNPDTNSTGEIVRQEVQNKLEALQLSERLDSRTLDLDAKFREAKHERGFGTENNGFLWSLMPQVSQNQTSTTTNQPSQIIPTNLAELLNELNVIQESYNQAWLDIESMRRQLYSQWYYYMRHDANFCYNVYDISLIPVRTAIAQAGELEFTKDDQSNSIVTAKTLPFGLVSKLNDYFSDYVEVISAAAGGNFQHWSDLQVEFENCGVTLSNHPTVITITQGESWEIQDNGQTYPVKIEEGILTFYIPPTQSQIALNLVNKLNELLGAIAAHNNNSTNKYKLNQFPSQNYWRANDPVVLLAGDDTKSPTRFGQDGRLREDDLLECFPLDFDITGIIENISTLQSQIEQLKPSEGEDSINFLTWTAQPWNPFAFHWSVLLYPSRSTTGGEVEDYQPNQIFDNYELKNNAIDLQLQQGRQSSFVPNGNSYQGFSILTPSVAIDLTERLTSYLNLQLLPSYYLFHPEEEQTENYLSENFQNIKNWYIQQNSLNDLPEEEKVKDAIFVALETYERMQTLECQAQMIGGFNDSLLLAQPTLQLEVDEPISTNADTKFCTDQIRWTLGDSLQYKILDGDIFNPIRSGAMSIDGLWLIDSFGQYQEIVNRDNYRATKVVTSYQMTPPDETADYQVLLSPRLAQPARINFHWLAADALHEIQMTKAPAKTPVCGWIIPNNLDSTLAISDHQGKSLGTIDLAGNWRNAPGVTIERDQNRRPLLSNHHLQKLVHYLLDQGVAFQQQFLSTVDNSLETIDPASFAEHTSLALLVGRPIALVRATFSLEVKGLPADDPTVPVESTGQAPATNGFTEVKVPIRLGDYQQLNDGLVGYWREIPIGSDGDYEYEGNIFYAPQSRLVDDQDQIQTEAEGLVYFEQTVDAASQGVTMLIDPRGFVHTTCGVLPNQELRLPTEHYSPALKAMEVNFLSTPILCSQGELAMPLSQESGAVWSWVSLLISEAEEIWTEKATISNINTKASFAPSQQVYEGWLQLSRSETTE